MQCNYKLKQAVAIALGIFALGLQQQAMALGLGELDVKSHLGQPFRAKIKVHDATDLKAGDFNNGSCFRLGESVDSGSALNGVNFKLGMLDNDEAILTLSTVQVVNEPILNLSIIAECGSAVRRDYVVLLDPVLTTETENAADDEVVPAVEEIVTKANKPAKARHHQITESVVTHSESKSHNTKKSSKNKILNTENNNNVVLHVPGGNANSQTNSLEKNTPKTNQPRLSISGGEATEAPLITGNLRLDKQLTFTPDANAAPIEDTEVQDEVTAMNNRLAHLTEQVAKLQSRNLGLESDNKLKSQQIAKAQSSENKFRWIGYTLGAVLLLVSGQLLRKWHWRRQYEKQIASTEAVWTGVKNTHANTDEFDLSKDEGSSLGVKSRQNADSIDEKSSSEQSIFESTQATADPFIIDEESYDLSILDHADVFLSHGRTSLAIQLLQNHLLDHPKQSITIWLFLLDLLAKENMKAVFEQTALECKEHFNIKISEFTEGNKNSNQNLESFPHLTEGLQQVWGTPASVVFLDDLIYNNRLEPRAGLDKGLIEELILLKGVAQENVNSAEVIQLDEKKVALMERKEAQLAQKRDEKIQKMHEMALIEVEKKKTETPEAMFEFNLIEKSSL